jgi:hypothetical protein
MEATQHHFQNYSVLIAFFIIVCCEEKFRPVAEETGVPYYKNWRF